MDWLDYFDVDDDFSFADITVYEVPYADLPSEYTYDLGIDTDKDGYDDWGDLVWVTGVRAPGLAAYAADKEGLREILEAELDSYFVERADEMIDVYFRGDEAPSFREFSRNLRYDEMGHLPMGAFQAWFGMVMDRILSISHEAVNKGETRNA